MMMRSPHPPHFTAVFCVWTVVTTAIACRISVVSGGFQPIIFARTSVRDSSSSRQLLDHDDSPFLAFLVPRCSCRTSQERHTKMNEDDDETERAGTQDGSWPRKEKSFNPFDYNASSLSSSSRNTFSLRSIQMKALNERLFAATSSEERRTILTEEQEMLLAPILDGDTAVGGSNNNNGDCSIYQQCRSSEERFVAFDTNLTERIARAQSAAVKTILQEMKDFVLDQQPSSPSPRRPPSQQ
jgi:hypothetical protein